jgi:hypothetical protein
MNALRRVVAHVGALLWAVVVPTLVMCFEGGTLKLATIIFATGMSCAAEDDVRAGGAAPRPAS